MNSNVINIDDFISLNEENFMMYAARHYDSPCLSWDEFFDDLKKVRYVKRLFKRFLCGGELKERLILNHITVLYNVFGVPAATKILFYKLDDSLHPILKTFLTYLNRMPERVYGSRNYVISDSMLPLNTEIYKRLESL